MLYTMKRLILTTFLAFCFVFASYGQRNVFVLVKSSVGLSRVAKLESNSMKAAYKLGAALDYRFLGDELLGLSIQGGVYYSHRGVYQSYTESALLGSVNTVLVKNIKNINLNYIDLPLLLNVNSWIIDDLLLYINLGPYLSLGLSGRTDTSETSIAGQNSRIEKTYDYNSFIYGGNDKSMIKPLDTGLQMGIGVEYRDIMLGFDVQYGFMNINHLQNDKTYNTISAVMSLGYRF